MPAANKEGSGSITQPPHPSPPTEPQTPLDEKPTQTTSIPLPPASQPSTVSNQSQPSRRPRIWIVVAIPLLILALLCIAGAQSLFGILGPRLLTPRPTQTLAPPTSLHTVTSQPANTATVVASQTILPTLTATKTSPTEASRPTPASPEATTVFAGPSGDWAVRIYQSDDANIILVNNHIVGVTTLFEALDWVEINSLLQKDTANYVTSVNLNREFTRAAWGFNLRHNDVIVWGNEATADSCLFCYTQTVQILPDDTVSEVNLRNFDKKTLSGSWTAKVKAADFGVIMVNGVAAAGSYNELDLGWFDITSLLYEGQDNIITVAIWNKDGDYAWDAMLRREETAVWGSDDKGSGQPGEVFFTTVIVDGAGNIVP